MSSANTRACGSRREQHVEKHRLLLLEGAGERDLGVQPVEHEVDDLLRAEALDVDVTHEHTEIPLRHGTRSLPQSHQVILMRLISTA